MKQDSPEKREKRILLLLKAKKRIQQSPAQSALKEYLAEMEQFDQLLTAIKPHVHATFAEWWQAYCANCDAHTLAGFDCLSAGYDADLTQLTSVEDVKAMVGQFISLDERKAIEQAVGQRHPFFYLLHAQADPSQLPALAEVMRIWWYYNLAKVTFHNVYADDDAAEVEAEPPAAPTLEQLPEAWEQFENLKARMAATPLTDAPWMADDNPRLNVHQRQADMLSIQETAADTVALVGILNYFFSALQNTDEAHFRALLQTQDADQLRHIEQLFREVEQISVAFPTQLSNWKAAQQRLIEQGLSPIIFLLLNTDLIQGRRRKDLLSTLQTSPLATWAQSQYDALRVRYDHAGAATHAAAAYPWVIARMPAQILPDNYDTANLPHQRGTFEFQFSKATIERLFSALKNAGFLDADADIHCFACALTGRLIDSTLFRPVRWTGHTLSSLAIFLGLLRKKASHYRLAEHYWHLAKTTFTFNGLPADNQKLAVLFGRQEGKQQKNSDYYPLQKLIDENVPEA